MNAPESDSIIIRWHGSIARHCPPVAEYYVYLLHFHSRYYHAGHYLGQTVNLDARLQLHKTGRGAKLMKAITDAGITFEVARLWKCETWQEARALERKLKKLHNGPALCPLCQHKPVDALVYMRQGHSPILSRPQGKRRPMPATRPIFIHR